MDEVQFQSILEAIARASQPGVIDVTTMLASVALAGCAVLALAYAKGQLDEIVNANRDAAATERARFLFNVDEMFENWHFALSRAAFASEMQAIREIVDKEHEGKPLATRRQIVNEKFSDRLFELKRTNTRQYTRLMKLCGFFETLEVLIKNGFIDETNVVDLYGPAILTISDACEAHITKRQELDPVADVKLYENFLALAGRVRAAPRQAKP